MTHKLLIAENDSSLGQVPTLEEMEAQYTIKVLWHTGGHKGNSCRILGISRPALDRITPNTTFRYIHALHCTECYDGSLQGTASKKYKRLKINTL
ncbi:helix-turn-helix domain-containing protein [Thiolapillus sp.]